MSVAWVGAGIAATGLVMSQSNASSAANAQEDAVNQANGMTQRQFDQTRADNAPFLANGTAASNKLAQLMGIGGTGTDQAQALRADLLAKFPTWNAGGDDAVAGLLDYAPKILSDPALQQAYGYTPETLASLSQFLSRAQAISQAPVTSPDDPSYGSLLKKFDQNDLDADPIYGTALKTGLEQGNQGINRQAAATGSLASGATLKALARFSTNLGASLGNDAFNRDASYKDSTFNKLSGVAGTGQTASSQTGAAGAAATSQIAQNTLALGNSRAAGAIGQTNSINSGISSAAQFYQNQQLLNSLNRPAANNPQIYGSEGGGTGFTQTGSMSG